METILYTTIRPAIGQTVVDVIRRAHVLGYELVPFNGWTDEDLTGARKHDARSNMAKIQIVQDACEINKDWPHILQIVPREQRVMEEEEGLAIIRQFTK